VSVVEGEVLWRVVVTVWKDWWSTVAWLNTSGIWNRRFLT